MERIVRWMAALVVAIPAAAAAQSVTLPPSGDNQRTTLTQQIGLARVTVDYSSPDVTGPNGENRRGKIWGGLVPFGIHDLGFNNRKGPWRAGANENTVFETSHAVTVQGQPLPAGRYGVFMLAGPREWTVIFSKNSTSWGAFSYEASEDALRVSTVPEPAPYREWLTYEFVERRPDRATLALEWEELRIPLSIVVEDMPTLYIENLRRELRNAPGFTWQNWDAAAQYCLQVNRNLDEALTWADTASSSPAVGQRNFTTLATKAQVLEKLGRGKEAADVMASAIDLPGTQSVEIHQYGRRLLAEKRTTEAMAVFEKNAKRFGDAWPVHVGLARGLSALGDYKAALDHARIALGQAPDPINKRSLETAVARLAQGKDMNTSS